MTSIVNKSIVFCRYGSTRWCLESSDSDFSQRKHTLTHTHTLTHIHTHQHTHSLRASKLEDFTPDYRCRHNSQSEGTGCELPEGLAAPEADLFTSASRRAEKRWKGISGGAGGRPTLSLHLMSCKLYPPRLRRCPYYCYYDDEGLKLASRGRREVIEMLITLAQGWPSNRQLLQRYRGFRQVSAWLEGRRHYGILRAYRGCWCFQNAFLSLGLDKGEAVGELLNVFRYSELACTETAFLGSGTVLSDLVSLEVFNCNGGWILLTASRLCFGVLEKNSF